jgi:TRAP-type C4-dicarboxylate transport system permease small subunit
MNAGPASARLIRLLTALERAVISGLMALIVILTLAQVFWRYVLELPLQWSEEVARYAFVWMTFLGAATLMRMRDGHPAIDTLHHIVGERVRAMLEIFSKLVVIAGSMAIATGGLRMVQSQWHQLSPSLEFPMAWIYLCMFLGPLLGIFWIVWCAWCGGVADDT